MSNDAKPHPATENALHRVRELTNAVKDILRDAQGKSEFSHAVRTIMKESPATCSPGDTLKRAAEILWNADCGMVPVVESDGRLVGVVTDRDICMTAFFRDQPLSAMDVASTMSRVVTSAKPDDTIESIVHLLGDKQLHRVPILENERLVGVVSLADIARQLKTVESSTACRSVAHALADISERRAPPVAPTSQAAE